MENHSVYLHIPFCRARCGYCDFNTTAGMMLHIPAYVEALTREMRSVGGRSGETVRVHTLFFGGGTPSLLPPKSVERILTTAREVFAVLPEAEITLEANPGTVSREGLAALRAAGVNRLSLGMQSAHAEDLQLLQRGHTAEDVRQAVRWAREAGFENLSVDLIFGLPRLSLERWKMTLEEALALDVEHLSLYSLIVEEGTPLARWVETGKVEAPDEDSAAEQYEWAMERLEAAGFAHYEISNWARRRAQGGHWGSLHNLQYWRNQPYYGFGAGAHGSLNGLRLVNAAEMAEYITRCAAGESHAYPRGPATVEVLEIDRETEIEETLMVGLRLTEEGVGRQAFWARFGERLEERYPRQIEQLTREGLVELTDDRLRLTRRGRLLGNRVFGAFLSGD